MRPRRTSESTQPQASRCLGPAATTVLLWVRGQSEQKPRVAPQAATIERSGRGQQEPPFRPTEGAAVGSDRASSATPSVAERSPCAADARYPLVAEAQVSAGLAESMKALVRGCELSAQLRCITEAARRHAAPRRESRFARLVQWSDWLATVLLHRYDEGPGSPRGFAPCWLS